MSCSICGRLACARHMHSVEDQERFDRAAEFDGNVRAIMDAFDARDSEIAELRERLAAISPKAELFDDLIEAARWSVSLCLEIGATETNAGATAQSALRKAVDSELIKTEMWT